MFKLELLENFIELLLRSADLLRNPIGTVLQVTTNITDQLSPDLNSTRFRNDGVVAQKFRPVLRDQELRNKRDF